MRAAAGILIGFTALAPSAAVDGTTSRDGAAAVRVAEPHVSAPDDTAPEPTTPPTTEPVESPDDRPEPQGSEDLDDAVAVASLVVFAAIVALAAWWMVRRNDQDDPGQPPTPALDGPMPGRDLL